MNDEFYPKVSIIILNWNGWKDTIECLESVFQIKYPDYCVIVLDNGSKDESIEMIKNYINENNRAHSSFSSHSYETNPIHFFECSKEEADSKIKPGDIFTASSSDRRLILIKNEENSGFAEGNNIAMRYAINVLCPQFMLLLNNDTIVDSHFLEKLIAGINQDSNFGIAGPTIYYHDLQGRKDIINFAGGKINYWNGSTRHIGEKEPDEGQYDKIRTVDYVEGSCLLIKTTVIKQIGFLNPFFFTYWEETDWCVRAKEHHYYSIFVPGAKIWHKIGASNSGAFQDYYMTRNRFFFMRMHAKKLQYFIFLVFFFGFQFWLISGSLVFSVKRTDRYFSVLRGVIDGVKTPKKIFSASLLKDQKTYQNP